MRTLLAALSIVVVVCGCAVSEAHYKQTWTKAYSETTCSQWSNRMTDRQREAASYDLIRASLRTRGSNDRPSYNDVLDYRSVLNDECAKRPSQPVTTAASHVSFTD